MIAVGTGPTPASPSLTEYRCRPLRRLLLPKSTGGHQKY